MPLQQTDAIANVITHGKSRIATDPSQWKTRLERFLAAQPGATEAATVEDLRLPPASGGASSGTILFTAHYATSGASDKLVLRFQPPASHAHEYDMVGQYKVLSALEKTDVPVPRVFGIDDSGKYFGVPGFLMGYIDGTPLPTTYPTNGPLFDASHAARAVMVLDVLEAMARVHRVDWRGLQLEQTTRKGKGKTALERDLDWYRAALSWGAPEYGEKLKPVMAWLLDHQFEPKRLGLCHGDTSLPNYMFKHDRLVAVLDWEFAFIGAPELDLGFQIMSHEVLTLGHAPLAGIPDTSARLALYRELSGHELDNWDYYFTFACLKLFIHMALTFRGAPPSLDAARDKYLTLTSGQMLQSWDAARR